MNSTKKTLIFSIVLLFIGIICLLASTLNILTKSSLNSSLFGIGCGFTASGFVCSINSYRILKNPTKLEEVELNEHDERNKLLREKTNSKVYSIFIYIECALILISCILGYKEVSFFLSFLILSKSIMWFIICSKLSKKY